MDAPTERALLAMVPYLGEATVKYQLSAAGVRQAIAAWCDARAVALNNERGRENRNIVDWLHSEAVALRRS